MTVSIGSGSVLKRGPCLVLDLTLRVLFCFLLTLGLLARRLLELTVLCGAVFFPLRLTGSSPEMAPATPCRNPKISAFVPLAPMTTMNDKGHGLVIPTCYQCPEITVTVSPTMEKVWKEPSRRSPVSTSLQLGCRNSRTSAWNPCRSELICGSLCSRTGSQSWSIRSWDCAVSCCARSWCSILGLPLGSQPPGPSGRPCEPYGPQTCSVQPLS